MMRLANVIFADEEPIYKFKNSKCKFFAFLITCWKHLAKLNAAAEVLDINKTIVPNLLNVLKKRGSSRTMH